MEKEDRREQAPLVSICLVTYNHERYIKQAVDSILNQHMNFTYELLIADDASTDRTQQILRDNYSNTENVRLILRHENTRINGYLTYQEARGKYIYLCEGDDYCLGQDSLQTLVNWLEEHQEYVGVCGRRITLSEKTGCMFISYDVKLNNKEIVLDDFLSNKAIFDMCATLYRNFYNDKKYDYRTFIASPKVSDVTRVIYILLHGKVFQLDKVVGVYRADRVRDAGSYNTTNTPKTMFEDHMNLLLNLEQLIGRKLDYSGLRKRYLNWYINSLSTSYEFIKQIPYIQKKVGGKITAECVKSWINKIK